MKNLAYQEYCDIQIADELEKANLTPEHLFKRENEVPAYLGARLGPWTFQRDSVYWSVSCDEREGLPIEAAQVIWASHGHIIRLFGDCACRSPNFWLTEQYSDYLKASFYHVDTQEGLNTFVKYLKEYYKL